MRHPNGAAGTGTAVIEALMRTPLAAVLDTFPSAAFLYDPDGRVVKANTAARELFGLDVAPEFAVLSYEERVARLAAREENGQQLDPEQWYITRLLRGETILPDAPLDATITTLDGRERRMSFTGAPIYDESGAFLGALALGRDITEQHQAAQAAEREREAAQTAHDRLAAVQSVMDAALAHLSPDELVRELLARIRAIMHADNAAILLDRNSGKYLTVSTALGPEEAVVGTAHIPVGRGVAGTIAATRTPLLVDDLSAVEVVNPLLRQEFRSLVGVPLLLRERLLGVLHVDSVEPSHFTADDLGLLGLVAGRVALALDRAQLYETAERERRDAATRAQELETFVNTITDAVMLFGPGGEVTLLNPAARSLLSPRTEDEYARPLAERGTYARVYDEHGIPLPESEWPYERILRGEVLTGANAVDVVYTWPDGRTMQVNVSGAPVRDGEGRITGALCILHDVTERRELERRTHEALEALLEMAQALVDAPATVGAGDTAADSGADGQHRHHGQPRTQGVAAAKRIAELTCRVLGCSRVGIVAVEPETEVLRAVAVMGLPPEQEARWWGEQRELERQGVRLGAGADPEGLARFRAGEVFVLDMTAPRFRDLPNPYGVTTTLIAPMRAGNALVGILSLDYGGPPHAFTEEERALAGAVAQLGGLVLERDRLLRERAQAEAHALALEEANQRMNDFLSVASHELRTPLTVIKTNLQILARLRARTQPAQAQGTATGVRHLPDDEREALLMDRSERQVDRLVRLVEDMLDVSRVQRGKLEMRMESADLLAVMRDEVEQQHHAHPGRDIRLEMPEGYADGLTAVMDLDRVGQVVTNFLTNALKYSEPGRPVVVRVAVESATGAEGDGPAGQKERARVSVRDEGPGLPPEERERVWEMFHRVRGIEVRSGSGVGLGLGLHIARTIVERHGGTVGVESEVGEGSTFWFTLPLGTPDAAPTRDTPQTDPR